MEAYVLHAEVLVCPLELRLPIRAQAQRCVTTADRVLPKMGQRRRFPKQTSIEVRAHDEVTRLVRQRQRWAWQRRCGRCASGDPNGASALWRAPLFCWALGLPGRLIVGRQLRLPHWLSSNGSRSEPRSLLQQCTWRRGYDRLGNYSVGDQSDRKIRGVRWSRRRPPAPREDKP